jgi:CRISPR-associated protein Csx14
MGMNSIPVDIRNPGQVFACLGLLEAADLFYGPARARFNWENVAVFDLVAEKSDDPIKDLISFITECNVRAVSSKGTDIKDNFGMETKIISEPVCRNPEPKSSTLPVEFYNADGKNICVSHWASSQETDGLDNVKFWGGAAGYSAAARARDLKVAFQTLSEEEKALALEDPFEACAALSIGFRLEMRRDYTAIDAGFSPNDHKTQITVMGYPLVELFAIIGLEHSRPKYISRFKYRYAVWGDFMPPLLARPILGGQSCNFSTRYFVMSLSQVNKGGDRAISFVTEENQP